jgi:riboflavin kinase/FMN adenylyltransferase
MKLHHNIEQLPAFRRAVITIGSFDGVHLGHQQILEQLKEEARKSDGETVVITFYPHPKHIIDHQGKPIFLLNTPQEKYERLQQAGIDHVVEVPFTREFSEQTAEDYIRDFLANRFHPAKIVIGYDHRFGRNRAGDYQLLLQSSSAYGFDVIEIPEHVLKNITISSTTIRQALQQGDILTANENLGYRYFINAHVVRGQQLGRSIGFPTANLQVVHEKKLIPGIGVYAVFVQINGEGIFRGMMNIGNRPTVDGKELSIEVHILNWEKELYGRQVTVSFLEKIRDEIKFNNLEELKHQLERDKIVVNNLPDFIKSSS